MKWPRIQPLAVEQSLATVRSRIRIPVADARELLRALDADALVIEAVPGEYNLGEYALTLNGKTAVLNGAVLKLRGDMCLSDACATGGTIVLETGEVKAEHGYCRLLGVNITGTDAVIRVLARAMVIGCAIDGDVVVEDGGKLCLVGCIIRGNVDVAPGGKIAEAGNIMEV